MPLNHEARTLLDLVESIGAPPVETTDRETVPNVTVHDRWSTSDCAGREAVEIETFDPSK